MKIKFSNILTSATIVFISLLSFVSFGQDEGSPINELQDVNHQELNLNDEDKTLIYDQDSKSSKNVSSETHQNSVAVPAKAKSADAHKQPPSPNSVTARDGDDALSFNFLFYIIQKYKFSDIIDQ
jgi:hypothetical protein